MRINLKKFRQAHGLFQSELAAILDLSQSNVSRAELRGYLDMTFSQQQALYDKYGKDDVDSFVIDGQPFLSASNNTNEGGGTQNNGYFGADNTSLEIIKKQSDAIVELAAKQIQQTDRIITLLEKLSERL